MSTTTILAPRSLRARVACVITLTWVFTALVPQIVTRSDFAISRGSAPASFPVPAIKPVHAGLTQPVDAVALHQAHGAGVIVRPYRFGAVLLFGAQELLGDEIERVVPRDQR